MERDEEEHQTNGSSGTGSVAKVGNGRGFQTAGASSPIDSGGVRAHRTDPKPSRPKAAPSVAVVVPTYNEADNLPELAHRLFSLDLPDLRLYVVDDGSPDGTERVAAELSDRFDGRVELIQRGSKQGLGSAYVEGFEVALASDAEYIVQMDADLSHAPEALPGLLGDLEQADVVVGSRYVSARYVGAAAHDLRASVLRRWLSSLANSAIRLVAGLRVKDATSGFKVFRSETLRSIDLSELRCNGFAFQTEVAHACERRGYWVVEHPITFSNRTTGESKMSMAIVVEAIWRLLPLRLKR